MVGLYPRPDGAVNSREPATNPKMNQVLTDLRMRTTSGAEGRSRASAAPLLFSPIVRVSRERDFLAGGFPLAEGNIAQALDLYKCRQALDLGEEELVICFSTLSEVKAKPVPSER